MITVQMIRYTAHAEEWHRFAGALGLTPACPPRLEWSEFTGDGILAIHHADASTSGRTELNILVDDIDATEAALARAGLVVNRRMMQGAGPVVTVTAASGAEITVSGGARPATAGPLAVQPLWCQEDLTEPRRILELLGLRPRIAANSGVWIDFTADGGGQAGLHVSTGVGVTLGFEYSGDLDAYAERLAGEGLKASVHDEAYNRTLHVTTPDGDVLWINGHQTDLHGYTRMGG